MLIPTNSINAWRALVVWVCRAAALILITLGTYLFLKRILWGVLNGDPFMPFDTWDEVAESNSTFRGIAMIAVGIPLALLSRWIARWVVIVPSSACPGCGYDTHAGSKPHHPDPARAEIPSPAGPKRCPECGLEA